jgi:hypothetical protein
MAELTMRNSLACGSSPVRSGRSLRVPDNVVAQTSMPQSSVGWPSTSVRHRRPRNRILTPLSAVVRIHRTRLPSAGIPELYVYLGTEPNRRASTVGPNKRVLGRRSNLASKFYRWRHHNLKLWFGHAVQEIDSYAILLDRRCTRSEPRGFSFPARRCPNRATTHCNNSATEKSRQFLQWLFLELAVPWALTDSV